MLNLLRRLWYGFFVSFGNLFLRIGNWGKPRPRLPDFGLLQPLAVAEIEELADFLQRYKVHHGCVADIYALDGFLTCILIGPCPISPQSWLDFLFDDEYTDIPEDVLSHQLQLIARFYNMIATQLSGQPPAYEPTMVTYPGHGKIKQPLRAWCDGFMAATVLLDAAWELMIAGTVQQRRWLYPIWEYLTGDKEGRINGKTIKVDVAYLSKAVLNMRAYWIQHPYN